MLCSFTRWILEITFVFECIASCNGFQDAFQLLNNNRLNPKFIENNEVMPTLEPEAKMNVAEMIRYNGYPVEEHNVTTEDGYIITIQRIPHGRSGPGDKPRQPVILQHGLFATSIIWVFNTPSKSLGFILADSGYDVWLSNIRGNTYGRRHKRLSPDQKEFWEFSFDEMARYDLPAIVDFVLDRTGFNQTNLIGHSMGTMIALIMLSERPEYNDKIRSAMLLGPGISMQHIRIPLSHVLLKPFVHEASFLVNLVGGHEIVPYSVFNYYLTTLASAFCNSEMKQFCMWLPYHISEFNAEEFNASRIPVYIARFPGGASLQTVMHYVQFMNQGFRRYDYGKDKNMEKYGQPTPPMYSMSNITAPIALYWGESDTLADSTDVDELAAQIRNLVIKYKVPFSKFTHVDFVWAINAKSLVYDKVIQVMKKLWPST